MYELISKIKGNPMETFEEWQELGEDLNKYNSLMEDAVWVISIPMEGHDNFVIPMEDNIDVFDGEDLQERFKEWKQSEKNTFDLIGVNAGEVKLTKVLLESDETVECEETGWQVLKSSAYLAEHYDRPYDEEPENRYFGNWHLADCFEGSFYSKDFPYYTCECCERKICYQNPSNGWFVQMKVHDGWIECNKCHEESLYEGREDCELSEVTRTRSLQFTWGEDFEENGWKPIGHFGTGFGRYGSGYRSEDAVWKAIDEFEDEKGSDFYIAAEMESVGIGGSGYNFNLWVKPIE